MGKAISVCISDIVITLCGLVRSSGVVGVDEKWVLVPKNDEPEGKRRRWMYVYLAVDVFTYDVLTRLALHIDVYPHNGKDEARAFLQTLKAKGYQPRIIVTDTNQDYTEPIHTVFPQAIHHECIFHALQGAQQLIKVYSHRYAQTHPEAVLLKEQIYAVFQAKSQCHQVKQRRFPRRRAGQRKPRAWDSALLS